MKRIYLLITLLLFGVSAFAQETPPTGLLPVNGQFYIKIDNTATPADTAIWHFKGSPYGWERVLRYKDLSLTVTNTGIYKGRTLVFMGDSWPAGYGISSPNKAFPALIARQLGANLTNISLGGATVQTLASSGTNNLNAQVASVPTKTDAIAGIIIHCGGNDAGYNATASNVANFQATYINIINAIIAKGYKPSQIRLVSLPYVSDAAFVNFATSTGTPAINRARLLAFNSAIQTVAAITGAEFSNDYYKIERNVNSNFYQSDLFHPNEAIGHPLVAKYLLEDIFSLAQPTYLTPLIKGAGNTVSLQQASSSTDGYVSTFDYNAFGLTNPGIYKGKKIVFIGDEYPVGFGVTTLANRFSTVLCNLLGSTEVNLAKNNTHIILNPPGNTSDVDALRQQVISLPTKTDDYALLVIHCGGNDAATNMAAYNTTDFVTEFNYCLTQIFAKGWLPSQVRILGLPYLTDSAWPVLAQKSGTAAIDRARWLTFDNAIYNVALANKTEYTDEYYKMQRNYNTGIFQSNYFVLTDPGQLLLAKYIAQDLLIDHYVTNRLLSGNYQPLEDQRLSTTNSPAFVNEVITGRQSNAPQDVSNYVTFNTGFTLGATKLYNRGKSIFDAPGLITTLGTANNTDFIFGTTSPTSGLLVVTSTSDLSGAGSSRITPGAIYIGQGTNAVTSTLTYNSLSAPSNATYTIFSGTTQSAALFNTQRWRFGNINNIDNGVAFTYQHNRSYNSSVSYLNTVYSNNAANAYGVYFNNTLAANATGVNSLTNYTLTSGTAVAVNNAQPNGGSASGTGLIINITAAGVPTILVPGTGYAANEVLTFTSGTYNFTLTVGGIGITNNGFYQAGFNGDVWYGTGTALTANATNTGGHWFDGTRMNVISNGVAQQYAYTSDIPVGRTSVVVSSSQTLTLNADYLNTSATQYTLTLPPTSGFSADGSKIITALATGTGGFKISVPSGYAMQAGTTFATTTGTGGATLTQGQKVQLIPVGVNSYYLQPLNGSVTVF